MSLPRFYPIFDSADWIERLVPLGIQLVQLRVKDRTLDEVRTEIRRAKTICAAHDCQLVVNDYWQLAIEEGCAWLHLGQEDLDTADLDAIRAAGLRLGLSTHDGPERRRALDVPLVAIGGMSVERAPGAFAAGADVVSAVTDITLNPDPEARVRAWLEVAK
jgi:thiamine-phosphate pyrophosphorylase